MHYEVEYESHMKDKNSRALLARGMEAVLFHGLCSDDGSGTRRRGAGGSGSSLTTHGACAGPGQAIQPLPLFFSSKNMSLSVLNVAFRI